MNRVHYESYQEKDKMLLKVLDEDGNVTNIEKTKKEVHDEHLWHQEVAIFIINSEGKILLQKRSNNVHYNNPNHLSNNQYNGPDWTIAYDWNHTAYHLQLLLENNQMD